jgi:hypothetical protein
MALPIGVITNSHHGRAEITSGIYLRQKKRKAERNGLGV